MFTDTNKTIKIGFEQKESEDVNADLSVNNEVETVDEEAGTESVNDAESQDLTVNTENEDVNDNDTSDTADAESEKTQDSDAAAAQKQTVEQVEVSILPGEYSDTISQKLLDAGLIDDKAAFSKYINDTNVDNLIQPGTFTVPKGASYEEVAKILTTKQENR